MTQDGGKFYLTLPYHDGFRGSVSDAHHPRGGFLSFLL